MTIKKFVKEWQPLINVKALEECCKLPVNTISRHVNADERPLSDKQKDTVMLVLNEFRNDLTKTLGNYTGWKK